MFYSDLEFLAGLLQGSRPLVLLQQHPIVDLTSESWYIKREARRGIINLHWGWPFWG